MGASPSRDIQQSGDGNIHVLLLADASEFVYRRLRRFEAEPLISFQAKWPHYNTVKVTVVPRFNNHDVCDAIALGGTFRAFHRDKMKIEPNM